MIILVDDVTIILVTVPIFNVQLPREPLFSVRIDIVVKM